MNNAFVNVDKVESALIVLRLFFEWLGDVGDIICVLLEQLAYNVTAMILVFCCLLATHTPKPGAFPTSVSDM